MNGAPRVLTKAFGRVVSQARREAGWTQEELAHRAGVHRTYVGDLENGRKSPTLDVVETLARAFGRPANELIAAAEALVG
ncbi:helix-turn-helix domain-containing protein [Luteimonas sp. R10]|uniref:helix-turn-helix domain-containing protein n=1 Tax=Luteimonas sp. R10 TaxID=3108176 RepID=UPI00308F892C|nr:helix-turn-helix transcriptional regulator [Luteimonas sp. R10]